MRGEKGFHESLGLSQTTMRPNSFFSLPWRLDRRMCISGAEPATSSVELGEPGTTWHVLNTKAQEEGGDSSESV